MEIQYIARRSVKIKGRVYVRGEPITDPSIPPEILNRLMSTGKLQQHLVGDDGVASAPKTQLTLANEARQSRGRPPKDPDAGEPDNAAVWRAVWPGGDVTFRQYLLKVCEEADLPQRGSVIDILNRLAEAGIEPVFGADEEPAPEAGEEPSEAPDEE